MMRALSLTLLLLSPAALADAKSECATSGGKWTELPNGQTGCRVKGQNEGEWVRLLAGGQLMERTFWKSGKRHGPSVRYFEHCQVMERGEWKDGRRDGPWVFWNEEGKKEREGSYLEGRETGVWTHYHRETGLKHLEGPFVRGFAEGTFTEYLPRGEKWREVVFKAGRRVGEGPDACDAKGGEWVVDFKQRREGCVVKNRDEGVWFGYDGNGKLRWRGTYAKGRLNGLYEEFHPTGERLRRGSYEDGVPSGPHEFRGVDGTVFGKSIIRDGTGSW